MKLILTALVCLLCLSEAQAGNIQQLLFSYGKRAATPSPSPTATPVIILVQQKVGSAAGSDLTINLDAPITAGNVIIVCTTYPTISSIRGVSSESDADELAPVSSANGTTTKTDVWATTGVTGTIGGATDVLIHFDVAPGRIVANVSEWNGLLNANAESEIHNFGSIASVTLDALTPMSSNNLFIATGGWVADDYLSGPTNSFIRMTPIGNLVIFQESAYIIQTSATMKTTSWELTTGIDWSAAMAEFGAP